MTPFEQVVTEHGPTVLRVCRAILGSHEAEDAWSETFLSALRAYPDLPSGSNIRAWLVTIAKRKAIDQHRTRSRQPMPTGALPDQPATDRYPADCDDTLWAALEALPRKQREAIAYHHLAGMPYAQVGELLGNSESAARRAAADGMRTLRTHYRGAAS
ncbi:MAG: RNA polymerase sigma factor [Actinomycetota bacterium]|nr:RNA polymerase sigma factor [Actinomycetota bacterium]